MLTVAISLVSAIVGAIGSQALDFVKTRQLEVEKQRSAHEDRAWTESAEMYRQLYAMRGRLTGSLSRHHFAVIERRAADARAVITRRPTPPAVAAALDRKVQERIEQVLRERGELELLLGWAELTAPAGDADWAKAIHELVYLEQWNPATTPPTTTLAELQRWSAIEARNAQQLRKEELQKKFGTLLTLIREQRKHIRLPV